MKREKEQSRTFQGIVNSGRGLGGSLMSVPNILERLQQLVGCLIVPGTLNLRLTRPFDVPLANHLTFAELGIEYNFAEVGLEFDGAPGFYSGRVVIAGRYNGWLLRLTDVGRPPTSIELISDYHLRSTLGLQDGDTLEFALVED